MMLCRPKEQDPKAEKPESNETSKEEQGAQAQSHAAEAVASKRDAAKDADQAAASQHAPGLPSPWVHHESTRTLRSKDGFVHSCEGHGTGALFMLICIADVHPGRMMCSLLQGACFRSSADRKGSYLSLMAAQDSCATMFLQTLSEPRKGIVTLLRL